MLYQGNEDRGDAGFKPEKATARLHWKRGGVKKWGQGKKNPKENRITREIKVEVKMYSRRGKRKRKKIRREEMGGN